MKNYFLKKRLTVPVVGPHEHRPRGKPLMQMDNYRRKCQDHIVELQGKMAAIDKKNPQWSKYRMQKIAYEARLRNRQTR